MKNIYLQFLIILAQLLSVNAVADELINETKFSMYDKAVSLEDVDLDTLKQISAQIEGSPFAAQKFKKLSFEQELIHAKYKMSKEHLEFSPLKNGWVVQSFVNAAGESKTLSLAGIFNVSNGRGLKVKQLSLPKTLNAGEQLSFHLLYEDGYQVQNECTVRRSFYAQRIVRGLSGGAVLFACQEQSGSEGSFARQTFEQVWLADYGVMIVYDSIQAVNSKKSSYLKYYKFEVTR